jgi:N-acetylmuramoyl-L-alanine amidase
MRRFILTLAAAMLMLALVAPVSALAKTPVTGKTIMLDAGHGGRDPGSVHPTTRVAESWINLAVVHRLKDKLEADGARVLTTRLGDQYLGLAERAMLANRARPDVFVSVHHNGAGNGGTNGTETYFSDSGSYGLANSLNTYMVKNMHTANRGVKQKGFAVTRLTRVPAVLTEASFITNDAESHAFINLDRVEQEAMGLQQGLLNYFANR